MHSGSRPNSLQALQQAVVPGPARAASLPQVTLPSFRVHRCSRQPQRPSGLQTRLQQQQQKKTKTKPTPKPKHRKKKKVLSSVANLFLYTKGFLSQQMCQSTNLGVKFDQWLLLGLLQSYWLHTTSYVLNSAEQLYKPASPAQLGAFGVCYFLVPVREL